MVCIIFIVFKAAKDTKVVDAKIFTTSNSTGIAVLTSTNRIFLVNNVSEPKVRPITDMPSKYNIFIYSLNFHNCIFLELSQLLLVGYGSIDCWYMVHCDRETQVILSNREGIFVIHQSHQNTFSFVSIL